MKTLLLRTFSAKPPKTPALRLYFFHLREASAEESATGLRFQMAGLVLGLLLGAASAAFAQTEHLAGPENPVGAIPPLDGAANGLPELHSGAEDRAYAVRVLTRISEPVLTALAEGRLKQDLPVRDWERRRAPYAPLEAFGRTWRGWRRGSSLARMKPKRASCATDSSI